MTKNELIQALLGRKFRINGKECIMKQMSGSSSQVWIIKNSWWKETVINANRLTKEELEDLYNNSYE